MDLNSSITFPVGVVFVLRYLIRVCQFLEGAIFLFTHRKRACHLHSLPVALWMFPILFFDRDTTPSTKVSILFTSFKTIKIVWAGLALCDINHLFCKGKKRMATEWHKTFHHSLLHLVRAYFVTCNNDRITTSRYFTQSCPRPWKPFSSTGHNNIWHIHISPPTNIGSSLCVNG